MLSRLLSHRYIVPFIGSLLWVALCVTPRMAYAQAESDTAAETTKQSEKRKTESKSSQREDAGKGKQPPEGGKTIWLEEKLNPSTQWLEKAVKPLTRWIEDQVQLDPKGPQKQNTARPQALQKNQATEQNSTEDTARSSGPRLSKDQIRQLVKQRYAGDVLHIKSLANARYRVKLISQQGVIQILYLSAIDGQELSP